MNKIKMLSPREADAMVKRQEGAFIDIRTVSEALAETLPDSLFLPFDLVSPKRLEDLGVEERIPIMVCRSGSRAKQAAEALADSGEDVAVLEGGMDSWKEDGLPIASGRKTVPLDRQVLVAAGSLILLFTILGLLVSPFFFVATLFMSGGMIFAGATGACGMARVLIMMPWNKSPLCGKSCESS